MDSVLGSELMCLPIRFREPAARGPYLWDWANECELRGLGYVPTSMGGHHFITLAALRVLPEVVRWLRGEARLLTWAYCGFPDMNWPQYGTFGTEMNGARMPDSRREWEISHYCRFNALLEEGHFIGHHPKQAIEGVIGRYEDACRAAEAGDGREAMRFLGAAVHYLEDCGSPPHAGEISGPSHVLCESVRDVSGIGIDGYHPAETIDFRHTVDRLDALGQQQCQRILPLVEAGKLAEILPLQVTCANECAKAVADMLNQFFLAYSYRIDFAPCPAPAGCELLYNGDFGIPGDILEVPDGWVMYWEDRADAEVEIKRIEGEIVAQNVTERVACVTTWPKAIRGVPGQTFRIIGEICCEAGEAGVEAICLDDATCPLSEVRQAAMCTGDWERAELTVVMPENGEILRPGVYARHAKGPVRFRSLKACAVGD